MAAAPDATVVPVNPFRAHPFRFAQLPPAVRYCRIPFISRFLTISFFISAHKAGRHSFSHARRKRFVTQSRVRDRSRGIVVLQNPSVLRRRVLVYGRDGGRRFPFIDDKSTAAALVSPPFGRAVISSTVRGGDGVGGSATVRVDSITAAAATRLRLRSRRYYYYYYYYSSKKYLIIKYRGGPSLARSVCSAENGVGLLPTAVARIRVRVCACECTVRTVPYYRRLVWYVACVRDEKPRRSVCLFASSPPNANKKRNAENAHV